MAEVFLAETVDAHGDQMNIALKLMRSGVSEQAFADEADLMGLLTHPNLVQRLEIGQAFGRPFIAMEFLIGGDLREVMSAHRRQGEDVPVAMALHVVIEVLRALAYFHQAKTRSGSALELVHGDVNPANVFFSGDGEVKLGDFGVANSRSNNIGPAEGVTAGKLHYLSPEQTRGERLTGASDLFAVGVMLHELLLGHHPFAGTEPKTVVAAIRACRLNLPSSLDKGLAAILHKAIHADLKGRYRTAGEFAGDLFRVALDSDRVPTREDIRGWLGTTLELLV